MAVDEDLRKRREEICLGHMLAENAHRFDEAIAYFARPRYEMVATGEVFDGAGPLGGLMQETACCWSIGPGWPAGALAHRLQLDVALRSRVA